MQNSRDTCLTSTAFAGKMYFYFFPHASALRLAQGAEDREDCEKLSSLFTCCAISNPTDFTKLNGGIPAGNALLTKKGKTYEDPQ